MDEITQLKITIFDIENEQKGLQQRFNQLEQMKQPYYQRLQMLVAEQTKKKQEDAKQSTC
jgi:hypothetical protein